MITLSEAVNSSGVTTNLTIFFCLDARYLDILASVPVSVYALDMLTYSEGFSGFLQLYLIGVVIAKGVDIEDDYILGACTRSA